MSIKYDFKEIEGMTVQVSQKNRNPRSAKVLMVSDVGIVIEGHGNTKVFINWSDIREMHWK